jgi:hypothetical protein
VDDWRNIPISLIDPAVGEMTRWEMPEWIGQVTNAQWITLYIHPLRRYFSTHESYELGI